VGFGISGVETFGSATRELFAKMDLGEICCGDERWIELAQDYMKMWALSLAVLNLLVLLPELVSKIDMSWGWEVDGTGSR
jgi:hypothetical protein